MGDEFGPDVTFLCASGAPQDGDVADGSVYLNSDDNSMWVVSGGRWHEMKGSPVLGEAQKKSNPHQLFAQHLTEVIGDRQLSDKTEALLFELWAKGREA